jgi:multidrug efflux system membrane fusion protein
MSRYARSVRRLAFCLSILPLFGCGQKPALPGAPPTPTVKVALPIQREVTAYVDFTGRTDAIYTTEIRPRVTGYLVGMPYKEGAVVEKDATLFKIDDRPYKAALDSAKAQLEFSKASLVKAQADYDIGQNVKKENPGAISDQELVRRMGARDEAKASVDSAKAALDNAQLNFDWCDVKAPIKGQVNKVNYTLGNLVNANATVLTTLVSQEKMYVYFDVDENTLLYIMRHYILPSKEDLFKKKDAVPVYMELADEKGYPHKGYINFGANTVNPSTGTITLRGEFDNPHNELDKYLMRPGMFVRVRLPLGQPKPGLLVSEKAVASDQGNKCLYVVDDKNVVQYRRVTLGPLEDDGLRVIEDGLKPTDRVIVSGLQMVKPRMEVRVDTVPMPVTAAPKEDK